MTSFSALDLDELSDKKVWASLQGCSLAAILAQYCQRKSGIQLLVAPDTAQAEQLYASLQFFLARDPSLESLAFFPDWETLPYDQFSPHQDIISQRLLLLHRLSQDKNLIIVTAVNTLLHRLCPPSFLHQYVFHLEQDQSLPLTQLQAQLDKAGYRRVPQVLEHGEYALRGSIMDIYPMGSRSPYRIEWFDENIESLRRFDPDSQMTIEKIKTIQLLPAREFPFSEEGIRNFRRAFREQFPGNPSLCPLYEAVSEKRLPSGMEYYLPLFFEKTATFFDFLPKNADIFLIDAVQEEAESFWQEVNQRFEQRKYDLSRPIPAPALGFIPPVEWQAALSSYQSRRCLKEKAKPKSTVFNFDIHPAPIFSVERQQEEPFLAFKTFIKTEPKRCLLVAESKGRREVLLDLLKQSKLYPKVQSDWDEVLEDPSSLQLLVGPLREGCDWPAANLLILTEAQLFGTSFTPQRRRSSSKIIDPDLLIRNLAELRRGAPVVHLQFGVGRYEGLVTIPHDGILNEFLILRYAGDDKIYVPVTSLHLISRYTGLDADLAPLHKLGSAQWQKEKKKAAENIQDVAVELLDLYAKRAAKPGLVYELVEKENAAFAAGFPFNETRDQALAIEAIMDDLRSSRPMDRLICGDVGFGKTEVAMRAAFVAVQNNKQVCVLVPTTLLATQHFDTFRDRFAPFPVQIELLSRFRTKKESEKVLAEVESGRVDILIGTHKLFSKSLVFKRLSLLIIDEEHRFGVKQKEHIKALRTNIDVLSLTATPIPRTLSMAMGGLRDISLIATPPAKRLAIKTFWQERNNALIQEAILREILRGGQVYFLHNDVKNIERVRDEIQTLVPQARVKAAHGQMPERELERLMSDFYHQRFNVLVCTTIIETGIDIPSANTILIDRADKLGLAQLHQLRGRVGRSHHQAYAYLMTPSEKLLSSDSIKRLEAIVSLEDLGAGFVLASHDLEIRGAGELLGENQSGNMHAIGFSLYMDLLDRAVTALKEGEVINLEQPLQQGPEIELGLSALLPETYISDVHTRLILYKRISQAKDQEALDALQVELIDRFGLLPKSAKCLFLVTQLKWLADKMGVKKIQLSQQAGKIDFIEQPLIDPSVLISLIQNQPLSYRMEGPGRLHFNLEQSDDEARIMEIGNLLQRLQGKITLP